MFLSALAIVLVIVFGFFALAATLVFMFRDQLVWGLEVVAYSGQSAVKLAIQASVAIVTLVDELFDDLEIADEPLARALLIGVVGLLVGVVLVMLMAMVRNQPWVIITFAASVGVGLGLGFVADPDGDWSLGVFPPFPGRRGGSGPSLPLNL
jgi:hypothetical protein